MKKIDLDYFRHTDTLKIACSLPGKVLSTKVNGELTSGIITETEAYCGAEDKACHAYNYRKTKRTKTMFEPGGVVYIYLCYGMHHLFNIVTNIEEEPHAVLIRGIKVLKGSEIMTARTAKVISKGDILNGPGKLTKALGITTSFDKTPLDSDTIWVEDHKILIHDKDILATPRIGVDYAGNDAKLPYRFTIKPSFLPKL